MDSEWLSHLGGPTCIPPDQRQPGHVLWTTTGRHVAAYALRNHVPNTEEPITFGPDMLPMTGYTWVLLVWIAATLGGCCSGDPAASTAGRRQFIEAFNAEPSPCTLKGSGPEITQLAMTCEALPLERLRGRLQRACGAYQGVGFEQLTLIAQNGKTTCDLIDTRCNCP